MDFPFRWAVGRGLGLAFRTEAVYRAAKKFVANHASEKLPATEEAWDVMRGLSGCKRPKPPLTRCWPEIPRCDLSIIVPRYNTAAFVGECLDPILGQLTSVTFEVLAIDDGSSDDTGSILDGYACKDGRVKVVHQENRGFSRARNKGLDLISDDYEMRCFFVCACDLIGKLTAGESFAFEGALRPRDTSTALRTSNYRLWEISIV